MIYSLLADLVVLIHLTFIFFGVLGGLLTLWKRWIVFVHIPAAVWASLIMIKGWLCPLTPLENKLRAAGGLEGYSGGFIAHYITPVIYPEGITQAVRINLGLIVLTINIVIYGYVLYRCRRKSKNR